MTDIAVRVLTKAEATDLTERIRESAEQTWRFNVADIVSLVRANHGHVVSNSARKLVDSAIATQAKRWLGAMQADEDDADAGLLPLGLPRALAIPHPNGEGYYYIATDQAHWLQRYDEELDRVRPLMEADPDLTYAEACALLEAAA